MTATTVDPNADPDDAVPVARLAGKWVGTGNRCGHDPAHPRFISVVNPHTDEAWTPARRDDFGHKRKASFFYDADSYLNQFYHFPRMIPGLGVLHSERGERQRRSEWREDVVTLLSVLTHHVELASINWAAGFARVGIPTADGFVYYDMGYWLKKTRLSESRLKRAFGKLTELGYITRTRRWIERDKGRFKGLATSTTISLSLYKEMGLLESLKDAAKHAYDKLKQAATDINSSVARMLRCAVGSKTADAKPASGVQKVNQTAAPTDFPPTDSRHWSCQLPPELEHPFRRKYLDIMIERGADDLAAIYREAYLAVRPRK